MPEPTIIQTYDSNANQVYPRTSVEALEYNSDSGLVQGTAALAKALSEDPQNIITGNLDVSIGYELKTPEASIVILNAAEASIGILSVNGSSNLRNTIIRGDVSISGSINNVDLITANKLDASIIKTVDCSVGDYIYIYGTENDKGKIKVDPSTKFCNGIYNVYMNDFLTSSGSSQVNSNSKMYLVGSCAQGTYASTYTDSCVYTQNSVLYTKGLYVSGTQIDPTKLVLRQKSTDLITNSDQFNFAKSGMAGDIYINAKTDGDGREGNISRYNFCIGNGNENTLAELNASGFRCNSGSTRLSTGNLVLDGDSRFINDTSTKISYGIPYIEINNLRVNIGYGVDKKVEVSSAGIDITGKTTMNDVSVNDNATMNHLVVNGDSNISPIGAIIGWAGINYNHFNYIPNGWAICSGKAVGGFSPAQISSTNKGLLKSFLPGERLPDISPTFIIPTETEPFTGYASQVMWVKIGTTVYHNREYKSNSSKSTAYLYTIDLPPTYQSYILIKKDTSNYGPGQLSVWNYDNSNSWNDISYHHGAFGPSYKYFYIIRVGGNASIYN